MGTLFSAGMLLRDPRWLRPTAQAARRSTEKKSTCDQPRSKLLSPFYDLESVYKPVLLRGLQWFSMNELSQKLDLSQKIVFWISGLSKGFHRGCKR